MVARFQFIRFILSLPYKNALHTGLCCDPAVVKIPILFIHRGKHPDLFITLGRTFSINVRTGIEEVVKLVYQRRHSNPTSFIEST